MSSLVDFGRKMAAPLLAGGNLFLPAIAPWWVSEFSGRAGGLMGLKPSEYQATSKDDVAFIATPDVRKWDAKGDEKLTALMRSPAQIFVNGSEQDLAGIPGAAKRVAAFTGGPSPDQGAYRTGSIARLVPIRPLEQFVRGWSAAGEMIAACIRAGRMPVIWMSVWLEGAFVRNASFTQQDNMREPWYPPLFHKDVYIPPLAEGHVAGAFLDLVEHFRQTLVPQAEKLALAGQWLAEAKRAGKRRFAVLVGHSYPAILKGDYGADYPLEIGPSISDLKRALPAEFGEGDVALHLGYGPTQGEDVEYWMNRGVRLIHASPYGRLSSVKDHKNFIWLDLPWRPADACINVPGYSVRILPSSSSAETLAYFAILAEMAEAMGWK